jgi:outer membrane translocation and assembly module TamA
VLRSLLSAACLIALLGSSYGQNCPADKHNSPSTISPIRRVLFRHASLLPPQARQEITKALRAETSSISGDMTGVADEASERVRAAYQNEGYFKAEVTAKAVPVAEDSTGRYDIAIKVFVEGKQYRLGDLRLIHMTAFSEPELRDVFLIQRGEIFSREKISKGLEELRRVYGREGYINFTAVPDTVFDENNDSINLEIDVDEGKQFRLRSVEVLGGDAETKARVLNDLAVKPGDVYNSAEWVRSMEKFPTLTENSDVVAKRLDERDGWVDMVLDFRKPAPCTIDLSAPGAIELRKPTSVP